MHVLVMLLDDFFDVHFDMRVFIGLERLVRWPSMQ